MLRIFERSDEGKRFDEAMKMAKAGLMEACTIWEDMKASLSERDGGSYGERYSHRSGGYEARGGSYPMMSERDWHELQERRMRDSMGQYK